MVQYHHVHTATTTQAPPGLSEGTVHHSYTYGSIPLCTSGLSEGSVHHSYTHGSYHYVHQALVKGLYTIFILMVPGSIPSSTFSYFIQVLVKVYCTVYTCSTVFSVHELGGQKFIVSVFIKTAERRDFYT